jgi:hypothetical protein
VMEYWPLYIAGVILVIAACYGSTWDPRAPDREGEDG